MEPLSFEANGPVLVFGACNSNLEATTAIRDEAERLDIPADRTICIGDIAAFCADASATVEQLAIQSDCATWLDALPEALREAAVAEALQVILDLDLDAIAPVEPPRGYGRD